MSFPLFADMAHRFQWERLQELIWRKRVAINPKTQAVAVKLAKWHAQHPECVVSIQEYRRKRANLAQRRIERARSRL